MYSKPPVAPSESADDANLISDTALFCVTFDIGITICCSATHDFTGGLIIKFVSLSDIDIGGNTDVTVDIFGKLYVGRDSFSMISLPFGMVLFVTFDSPADIVMVSDDICDDLIETWA